MTSYALDHFYILIPMRSDYLTGIKDCAWVIRIKQRYSWDIIQLVESAITDLCKGFPSILGEHIY